MMALLSLNAGCAQPPVDVPVPRPEPLLAMNLGGRFSSYIISSHLQTGWARYLETVPAKRLVDGVGNWTTCQQIKRPADADWLLGTLHECGIGAFRAEVGWGHTQYRSDLRQPMELSGDMDAKYRAILQASRKHGFRLVVLLNAHQGLPCGLLQTRARFLEATAEGSTRALLQIDNPGIIRIGYSGISGLSKYCAAQGLFTRVEHTPAADANAYIAHLAKGLPEDVEADEEVMIATLQYRPFGDPRTDAETYGGWEQHADLVARIAKEEGVPASDIDFEIWNEMTFGTMFLDIENYDPSIEGHHDSDRMIETATRAIRKHYPQGPRVINGFANTSFFFGGFWHGKRSGNATGESYHTYGNRWLDFPAYARDKGGHMIEAFRNVDGFVPRYNAFFPEHSGNYIGSHSIISLMQPEMRDLLVEEERAPEGWTRYMTENGLFLNEVGAPEPWASRLEKRPEHYVSKYWLRMYPFYLNKGLTAIYDGSLRNPGDWKESWEQKWVDSGDTSHLAALEPVRRMMGLLDGATDVPPERLMQLHPRVTQLSGQEKTVFTADGAEIITTIHEGEDPNSWDPSKVTPEALTYRDAFCLLPFQIDDTTLAIAAYIQTRNIVDDVTDAGTYRIELPGVTGEVYRVHDPLEDREIEADVNDAGETISVTLTLTDCPIWVIVHGADGARGGGPVTATATEDD